jgi:hypothetical protein
MRYEDRLSDMRKSCRSLLERLDKADKIAPQAQKDKLEMAYDKIFSGYVLVFRKRENPVS